MPSRRSARDRVEELHRGLVEEEEVGRRARIHLELGRIAVAEGRIEQAVRHLREALVLDPRLEPARRLLADLGEVSRVNIERVRRRRSAVRALLGGLRRRVRGRGGGGRPAGD